MPVPHSPTTPYTLAVIRDNELHPGGVEVPNQDAEGLGLI